MTSKFSEREKVWEEVARVCPKFKPEHDAADNYHAVREIVLGGSIPWAGVWKRFTPMLGRKVMDVGANTGIFSAYCAVNGAVVFAYEPFEKAYRLLSGMVYKTGLEKRLFQYNMAIWTYEGRCQYLGTESVLEDSPAFNGSVQSDGIQWNDGDLDQSTQVMCIKLEDAVGPLVWDMVKMDIEGAECEVLLAAPLETLRRIRFMYVEFHPWTSESLYKQTVARLESVYKFEGAYWNADIGRWEAAYLTLS
jgi:FkbM family methyltransferase